MNWSTLNSLQLGKYGEYLAMMEFMKHGFDVYSSEVDDKGIDLVIRSAAPKYFDIQVKSVRKLSYIFLFKSKFQIRDNLLAAIILFNEGNENPEFYLVPSAAWKIPNALLVDRDYEGKKSAPEYGLNLSQRNLPLLEPYRFHKTVELLQD
jgi:hypothetical protein